MRSPTANTYLGTPHRPALPAPTYQEAYPRVTLEEVLAAIKERKRLCVWAHPRGTHRGYGLLSVADGEIDLLYHVFPFYGEPSGVGIERLQLRDIALGQGRSRQLLVCPSCDQGVSKLIFFQGWKCQGCQGLRYRSSAIDAKARRSERARQLEAELRAGRPKGVHESTMQKKRAELKYLHQMERRSGRRSVSTAYRVRLINSTWMHTAGHDTILEHISAVAKSQIGVEFDADYLLAWSRGARE